MKTILFLLLASFSVIASDDNDITHRPRSFAYQGDRAVFVDLQEARYQITYDVEAARAQVKALLKMNVVEAGHPVFDLIEEPTLVEIDGVATAAAVTGTPSNETKLRVLGKKLSPGLHELKIEVPLTTLVEFTGTGVKNAFWVTDLQDRFYLERYIPVNLEYDRVKMTFEVEFKGLKAQQQIFANGKVTWSTPERATVEFPAHFTLNSLYFHTTPVGSVRLQRFTYPSLSGQELPVTIYTKESDVAEAELSLFRSETEAVLAELEQDYGAFPHKSLILYNANLSEMGLGGMEYAGATVTNITALGHELFHSYFARGLAPANGNAGWIDEALASWRDDLYPRLESLTGATRMAAHPEYTRKTDMLAYSFGARFMGFLDGKVASKGGLKPFMNHLLETRLFRPLFTEDFIADLEAFYGEEFQGMFKNYVYRIPTERKAVKKESHPIHRKLNPLFLKALL